MVIVEEKDTVPAFASYTVDDAKSGPGSGGGSAAPPDPPADGKPKQKADKGSSKAAPKKGDKKAAPKPKAAPAGGDGKRVIASPYARRIAREAGVSLNHIAASGPNGRVVAEDVQQAIESGSTSPAGSADSGAAGGDGDAAFADVDVSQIKKVTARRLLESKTTVPHYYLSLECQTDELTALRKTLNATLEKEGAKVSVNDLVIKAAAKALKAVPEVNAAWHGDFIRQYENVDITVAVQTPAGLMVPIVRDADLKGLREISIEVKELAGKVRRRSLRPHTVPVQLR